MRLHRFVRAAGERRTCCVLHSASNRMKCISLDRRRQVIDLPAILRSRLRAARRRNPRFSLRSLAVTLRIHHSTLSQIVRGKRQLTAAQATAGRRYLGLPADAGPPSAATSRLSAAQREQTCRQFSPDTFELLASWEHSAILELTQVSGFEPDARWIAAALALPIS